MSEHPSICRYCPAHCPILVTVEDGRATRVVGDPESPLFGGYTCPKGRALPEQHASEARLLGSLARGPDGALERIDVELAMDQIAERVARIVAQHGPRSVALYVGTNSLPYPAAPLAAHSWLSGLGSKMFFTSNTIDQPGKQIALALHGGWQAGEQDFATADTWLLVGLNPLISKSAGIPNQNPARRLTDALARGMKLIVIDPRRSETAQRAHIHLQPRPGEDPALLAGMLRVILNEGLHDRDFVARETTGVEALAEAVQPFTPERVARRAGVDAADLVEAARLFAAGPRGCSITGTGPSFATRGTLTEYLSLCLNSVCGRWGRAGERALRSNVLLPHATPRAQPWAPYPAWGRGEKMRIRGLGQSACGMPTAALADEILLEGEGQVKALLCLGGNPMLAWPDQRKTHAALQKLELLVTVDPELSATARLADYVIAPKLTLETPGMTQPIEALKYFGVGIGYPAPFAQYTKAIVEPPPGSQLIEDWEFFYGLARRMDIALTLVGFYGWGRHVESPPLLCPLDMATKPSSDRLLEMLTERARIPLAEVKKHPHGHVFEEAVDLIEPREAGCEVRLELGDAHIMKALADAEVILRAAPDAAIPGDAARPFLLVPRRANNFLNSSGRSLAKLTGKRPYNPAFVHSQDLARLGLASGDDVAIASRHDEIFAIVEADDTLRPGVVAMTHGFGGLPGEDDGAEGRTGHRMLGSNTGRLVATDDDYDPVSGMPRMGAIPISIRAIDADVA